MLRLAAFGIGPHGTFSSTSILGSPTPHFTTLQLAVGLCLFRLVRHQVSIEQ